MAKGGVLWEKLAAYILAYGRHAGRVVLGGKRAREM